MKYHLTMIVLIFFALGSGSCAPKVTPTIEVPTVLPPTASPEPEAVKVTVTFINKTKQTLDYFQVNDGKEENSGKIGAGASVTRPAGAEQLWRIRDQAGNLVLEYTTTDEARQTATIAADAVSDPLADAMLVHVQKFNDEGRIPSTGGKFIKLNNFNETFSQIGYYIPYPQNIELENFVFMGHLKWSTATETDDTSACGVLFGAQPDSSDYAVFLDKSRVYFSSSTATTYAELGKTSGTGRVSFGNPAEADFSLVVYQTHAYVYVDGEFVGEYTLSSSKPLKGIFGYGIISGTNKDYGTRCEITNASIWSLK